MNRVYCATSGEVVEWPKALVLKTRDGKLSVGSNPTLSANYLYKSRLYPLNGGWAFLNTIDYSIPATVS